MIRVIFGEKGGGNTKKIIDMANGSLNDTNGSIVFIDAEGQYMLDLNHAVRFIDAAQYHIDGPKMFYGFLSGIASQDFDLERIYVDGFCKIVKHPIATLEEMFKNIEEFSERCGVDVILGISGDPAPEYMKKYIF